MVFLTFEQPGMSRMRKTFFTVLLLIGPLLFPVFHSLAAQSAPVPEYQVKATFLFQLTRFVDWSPEALLGGQTPLVIGILGEDPFGTFLDEIVRDEKAKNHSLVVERYRRPQDIKNCHVLFAGRAEAGRTGEILALVKNRSILTVSDADGFADRGGMIQLLILDNKVRLRINLQAAKAANLTISSKLLQAATVINPGPK